MRIETLAVHAGLEADEKTGAVVPPIHLSTTFERDADSYELKGFKYTRYGNPNRNALEESLARLEGGAEALAFPSGMSAIFAVFQSLAPGDHVLAPVDAYHGTGKLLREHLRHWGLEADFVEMSDLAAVTAALRPHTRLIWIETPSNPLITLTDISAVVRLARRAGARVACDNTWPTPLLQRPLELGADVVIHATTKYLGGHSDVMGGAVVVREKGTMFERLRALQVEGGLVPSPLDCWLLLRGLRTLPCRMRVHCENAREIASFLDEHPEVEQVYYPGLEHDPGHHIAMRQMQDFGGMLSFVVPGGREAAIGVARRLRLFTRATSLGGVESLIEHRATIEGPGTVAPEGLLRMSVGLEHSQDLLEDLEQALAR